MSMHFEKKLPIPAEIKQEYPLSGKARKIKKEMLRSERSLRGNQTAFC